MGILALASKASSVLDGAASNLGEGDHPFAQATVAVSIAVAAPCKA
jgi:hypothetical protein